jgi:hypothetical protein
MFTSISRATMWFFSCNPSGIAVTSSFMLTCLSCSSYYIATIFHIKK